MHRPNVEETALGRNVRRAVVQMWVIPTTSDIDSNRQKDRK